MKQWIQVMDGLTLQNPKGVIQSHHGGSLLNMHMTFDLSEIKKPMPRGLNNKEAT